MQLTTDVANNGRSHNFKKKTEEKAMAPIVSATPIAA
jgi:hypothetical protein